MPAPKGTTEEFIKLYREHGPSGTAKILGVSERNVYYRRDRIEKSHGIRLDTVSPGYESRDRYAQGAVSGLHPESLRVHYDHPYDIAIFTDAHFWPGPLSPAYYIFCKVIEKFQPDVVLNTGDTFDGARVSRHPRRGWEDRPSMKKELDACTEALGLIFDLTREADHIWTPGNHDDRFANYISAHAPEFEAMPGARLEDYFPGWEIAESAVFNDTLLAMHDWHNGMHAAWNNVIKAGISTTTGHTHRCTIREFTDMRGTRYGMEGGTLADIYGPQFNYTKQRPVNWQSGFLWVHVDGDQIHPERVIVGRDGKARWRGETWAG